MELREAHRQRRRPGAGTADVKTGDIVIIHNQDHQRGSWKMGQIENLIVGRDGRVGGASQRLPPRSRHQKRLQCPLKLLYPLEISQAVELTSQEPAKPETDEVQTPSRPQRESATKARSRIKEWTKQILQNPDWDPS